MTFLYSSPTVPDAAAALAYLIFVVVWLVFALIGYILYAFFLMKIFEKAGIQKKWRAWVPVYNAMIFFKLGDLSPWLILIAIGASVVLGWVPVLGQLIILASFLLTLLAAWRVGLKLQKEAVWLILYFFLALVWYGINAFDKSRWNTAVPAAPWASNGFLSDKTTWEDVPSQVPAGGYPANPVSQPGAYPPPAAPQGYEPPAGYAPPPAASAPEPPAAPPAASEPPAAPEPPKV